MEDNEFEEVTIISHTVYEPVELFIQPIKENVSLEIVTPKLKAAVKLASNGG